MQIRSVFRVFLLGAAYILLCGQAADGGKGTPCDSNDFAPSCDGDVAKFCDNHRVHESNCAAMHKVCAMMNGMPQCFSPRDACSVEGQLDATKCSVHNDVGMETREMCMRSSDGKLYYQFLERLRCMDGCSADNKACKAVSCTTVGEKKYQCVPSGKNYRSDEFTCTEHNGKKTWEYTAMVQCRYGSVCQADGRCSDESRRINQSEQRDRRLQELQDPKVAQERRDRMRQNAERIKNIPKPEKTTIPCDKSYVSHCDGNVLMKCAGKNVRRVNCAPNENSPWMCKEFEKDAMCINRDDTCTAGGEEIIDDCRAMGIGKGVLGMRICKQGLDGGLYYAPERRICDAGCNAEGTACADGAAAHKPNLPSQSKAKGSKKPSGRKLGSRKEKTVTDELWKADW